NPLLAKQIKEFQADAACDAEHKGLRPGTISCESDLLPLDPPNAQRNPCEEKEIRNGGNLQDVMFAANVDTNNEGKFNQYQPSALAPGLATFATGFDIHQQPPLGIPLERPS